MYLVSSIYVPTKYHESRWPFCFEHMFHPHTNSSSAYFQLSVVHALFSRKLLPQFESNSNSTYYLSCILPVQLCLHNMHITKKDRNKDNIRAAKGLRLLRVRYQIHPVNKRRQCQNLERYLCTVAKDDPLWLLEGYVVQAQQPSLLQLFIYE